MERIWTETGEMVRWGNGTDGAQTGSGNFGCALSQSLTNVIKGRVIDGRLGSVRFSLMFVSMHSTELGELVKIDSEGLSGYFFGIIWIELTSSSLPDETVSIGHFSFISLIKKLSCSCPAPGLLTWHLLENMSLFSMLN